MNGPAKDTASYAERVRWLKDLRYQQLAAIMLERQMHSSVAAEDPAGDDMRRALATCWRILGDLSSIARQVEAVQPEALALRASTPDSAKIEGKVTSALIKSHELEISRRCTV